MDKIRVGVVGAGAIARLGHLPAYSDDPRVEVVGIVDPAEQRARDLAEQFGIPRTYPSLQALLEDGGAQAVSICVPNVFHHALCLEALGGGADVLVEKPMALNAAEAAEVVVAARESGKLLSVGMHNRFRATSQVLSRFIDAGRCGQLYHARAIWLRRRGDPGGWFTDRSLSGGGVMLDVGVHALDLAWWLMGRPTPVRASGVLRREIAPYGTEYVTSWPTAERPERSSFDVEDFVTAFVRFADGRTLDLAVSWAVNGPDSELGVDLYGTKGGARLDPLQLFTEYDGVLADVTPVIRTQRHPWREEVHRFVSAVVDRSPPPVPAEDGLAVVSMLEAIGRSAEEGREVEVPQLER